MDGEYQVQPRVQVAPPAESEDDVGGISEITILPDGRVYVLGLSAAVLGLLNAAGPWSSQPWSASPAPAGRLITVGPQRSADAGEEVTRCEAGQ